MVPLYMYLVVAAALFCLGVYAVIARRNAIAILMGIELMLNAGMINLVAFWRYVNPAEINGQVFAGMIFVIAAAEAAVGLALVIAIYRNRQTVEADDINLLKW